MIDKDITTKDLRVFIRLPPPRPETSTLQKLWPFEKQVISSVEKTLFG